MAAPRGPARRTPARASRWPGSTPTAEPPYIGSLSVNPANGSLLMGTNTGLFEIGRDGGEPVKVTGELTTPDGTGQVSESLVARFVGPDRLIASDTRAAAPRCRPCWA